MPPAFFAASSALLFGVSRRVFSFYFRVSLHVNPILIQCSAIPRTSVTPSTGPRHAEGSRSREPSPASRVLGSAWAPECRAWIIVSNAPPDIIWGRDESQKSRSQVPCSRPAYCELLHRASGPVKYPHNCEMPLARQARHHGALSRRPLSFFYFSG